MNLLQTAFQAAGIPVRRGVFGAMATLFWSGFALLGYRRLRQGQWDARQLVSADWVRQATARGPVGPDYGYLWWLNPEQKAWPNAPASSYAAPGAGPNTIWIDPEHNPVIVWRWHDSSPNESIKRVLAALNS